MFSVSSTSKEKLGNLEALKNNDQILQTWRVLKLYFKFFPLVHNIPPPLLFTKNKSNSKLGDRMTFHRVYQLKNSMMGKSRGLRV